jgi:hypothetical protein
VDGVDLLKWGVGEVRFGEKREVEAVLKIHNRPAEIW